MRRAAVETCPPAARRRLYRHARQSPWTLHGHPEAMRPGRLPRISRDRARWYNYGL